MTDTMGAVTIRRLADTILEQSQHEQHQRRARAQTAELERTERMLSVELGRLFGPHLEQIDYRLAAPTGSVLLLPDMCWMQLYRLFDNAGVRYRFRIHDFCACHQEIHSVPLETIEAFARALPRENEPRDPEFWEHHVCSEGAR